MTGWRGAVRLTEADPLSLRSGFGLDVEPTAGNG
jgi:hypothetical protein